MKLQTNSFKMRAVVSLLVI